MLKFSSENIESNLDLMGFIDTLIIHLQKLYRDPHSLLASLPSSPITTWTHAVSPIPTGNRASSSPPAPPLRPPCGGAAPPPPPPPRGLLRSRLIPDPIHHPATSLTPIASARASSSAPSAAAANNVVEEAAAAAVSVSQQAGSFSNALHYYGRCYWELSKARLRCAICFSCSPWIYCNVSWK